MKTSAALRLATPNLHIATLFRWAAAITAAIALVQTGAASTVTWSGGTLTTGTTLDAADNWLGSAAPGALNEVLFDNTQVATLPSVFYTATSATWGNLIWNTNNTGAFAPLGSAGNMAILLTGSTDNSTAIASGGAAGDLIVIGSAKTSGVVIFGTTNGGGTSKLYLTPLASGNIDVVNAGATLVINTQFATSSGGNVLTGSNSYLKKTGAGTLVLNNNNNANTLFTGSGTNKKFILAQGTLVINAAGALGSSKAVFEIDGGTTLDNTSGASITLNNYNQNWVGDFTYKGTYAMNTGTGSVTLSGEGTARTVTVAASTFTVGGGITGGYGLTKAGTGTLQLSGTSDYTGNTTITAGKLVVGVNNALPTATTLYVGTTSTSATLDLNAVNQTIGTLLDGGYGSGLITNSATGTGTLTVSSGSFGGSIKDGSSTKIVSLSKTGNGALVLSGSSNYSGATTISNGELDVNGSITTTGTVSIASGATLAGSGTVGGSVNSTGGTIHGSGLNLGVTTLNGGSTLSGYNIASSLTVATGTTVLSGTTKSATTVSVSAKATLEANGTIDGNTVISGLLKGNSVITGNLTLTSGTLTPGNSSGITKIQGDFSADATSRLVAEVSGAAAGISYDQVQVSGNVSLDGTLDLTTLSGLTLGATIILIDNTGSGTTTGYFSSIVTSGSTYTLTSNNDYTFTAWGAEYVLSYKANAENDGKYNDVTLTLIPEPGTWAMLLGGLGMLALSRRAFRRNSGIN